MTMELLFDVVDVDKVREQSGYHLPLSFQFGEQWVFMAIDGKRYRFSYSMLLAVAAAAKEYNP